MDATLPAYLAIAILALVAAAGAPLPVSSALTAAGVLAATARLDLILLLLVATVGAVTGDLIGYATGQIGGRWVRNQRQAPAPWLESLRVQVIGARSMRQIGAWCATIVRGRGGMGVALLLSRTIFAAFGPAVNILSGARRYPLRYFLLLDLLGELLWASAYIGVGYFAGSQGEDARAVITDPVVIGPLVLLSVGPVAATAWMRWRARNYSTSVVVGE